MKILPREMGAWIGGMVVVISKEEIAQQLVIMAAKLTGQADQRT